MDNDNFQNHFKKRLLSLSSAGLLGVSLCVATISIWPLYNKLKDQQTNELLFAVKQKSMVVEEFLAKAQETANQITSRSRIREFLEKYNDREINLTTLKNFTTSKLQDAINLSEFAVGISRLDIHGKLVVQAGVPVPEKFMQPLNFTSIKPTIKGPITIGNGRFIVVNAPIINRQKERVGTDIVLFTISKLADIIRSYTGLGKKGETVLGRLRANGQYDLFFKMCTNEKSQLLSPQPRWLSVTEKAFKKVAASSRESTSHLLQTPYDIAAYRQIKGTDWAIIVVVGKSELFKAVTRDVLIIVLLVVTIIIPLGIVGLIFLLRPLSDRILIHVDTLQQEITAKESAIRQQKISEEKLLNEKEQLSVTLRSIGDGVITTALEGHIVLMNKIAENLTGWSQKEAKGRPLQDVFNIINEKTGKPCDNPVQKVLNSKKIIGLANHTALIAKDGTQYSIEDSGAPIFNKESEIIGTVLVFRDVTTKKKTSEELLKVKKLESIGVLAGGIAHDFNNILAAILGNIELAGMSINSTEDAYPLLQEAKKASLRAKDLTQQLLTFSKGGDPVKRTASIGTVITESANFVLHGSAVSCHFDIPHDLWLVDIDSGQVSQVIQNLIINAKQAMPDGGRINIECANMDNIKSKSKLELSNKRYIRITVQDSGCGIAEKYLEKIFDPYFTTKQEGSGLGLAISHSIINKHDGYMEVKSIMGMGTTFTIYLPVSRESINQDRDKPTCKKEVAKARIIVMDDDKNVQNVARQMLLRFGHEVLLAADGKEAVRIFAERYNSEAPVSAIIMDLTIPGGMGGKDTIKELLKIDPDVKAIVSSGYSNAPVMSNYQQYGFKAAIAKPFMISELTKVLADVLG